MARMTRKEFLDGIKAAMDETPQEIDKAGIREQVMSMANRQPPELKMKPVENKTNTKQPLNKQGGKIIENVPQNK